MKSKKLLLPFYFGSVSEEERLHVEQDLLSDLELLTDFLDLKRNLEAANLQANEPSITLWERLRPKSLKQNPFYFSLTIGAALAAGLAIFFIFQTNKTSTEFIQPPVSKILFDSGSELPASSSVL